eukprot:CAMPEP_0176351452 /NCGR_PEP_ID=MMETSP0126-20121128/10252_1 /TAXON_ID=141414 ORGANISM="Strombidinopsis acuminatum, Strain SPMC142" /NCGR_SAMPLE_ID=MMETSP0126 /ASSEMBLY_ACC=CAM_ASM_000229 /LENGTH=121 /DNA_ID=CAMNT_0017702003 /DNA_START=44 /DNA_END=409 /DNA_ORIENTATION=-
MGKQAPKNTKAKKPNHRFVINCKLPLEDNVIVLSDFESFLKNRIKVEGKTGNLAGSVNVAKDKDTLVVSATIPFSKRYVKYLTKKYLKKQDLREFLKVVATSKNVYEIRYLTVADDGADEE